MVNVHVSRTKSIQPYAVSQLYKTGALSLVNDPHTHAVSAVQNKGPLMYRRNSPCLSPFSLRLSHLRSLARPGLRRLLHATPTSQQNSPPQHKPPPPPTRAASCSPARVAQVRRSSRHRYPVWDHGYLSKLSKLSELSGLSKLSELSELSEL